MTPTCSKLPRLEGNSYLGHSSPSPGNMRPHRSTSPELNVNSMGGVLGIDESVPAAKSKHCHNRASYGGSTVLCLYRISALACKLEDEYWRLYRIDHSSQHSFGGQGDHVRAEENARGSGC